MVTDANIRNGYPAPAEEKVDFDKLVYDTFSTTHGKELLSFLEKKFLMEPIWEPNNTEINCYFMEGRNNLVRLFIDRKDAYRKRGG